MKWFERIQAKAIIERVQTRPVVLLTGIRQSGKSELLKRLYPEAEYISFDHFHNIESATSNPASFLSSMPDKQVILDEIQYVPDLFRELKILIDKDRIIPARWILTGSQKFKLLESAKESLAGRIGIIELNTLGISELKDSFNESEITDILWKGGFPEIWSRPEINTQTYIDDYITTYLEKDLRAVLQVSNLRDFHRFLRACAVRAGSLVNFTDIARDTGTSPNTVKSWVNSLEKTGVISLVEPWFRNIGKRLAKTPKLFFSDQGLLCRLLNIENLKQAENSNYIGCIWENFVFNELIRTEGIQSDRNLFFYRDQNNVEVDFLIEKGDQTILIEAKYAEKPGKTNIKKIADLLGPEKVSGYCACRVPAAGVYYSGTTGLFNPILEPISSIYMNAVQ